MYCIGRKMAPKWCCLYRHGENNLTGPLPRVGKIAPKGLSITPRILGALWWPKMARGQEARPLAGAGPGDLTAITREHGISPSWLPVRTAKQDRGSECKEILYVHLHRASLGPMCQPTYLHTDSSHKEGYACMYTELRVMYPTQHLSQPCFRTHIFTSKRSVHPNTYLSGYLRSLTSTIDQLHQPSSCFPPFCQLFWVTYPNHELGIKNLVVTKGRRKLW